MTSVLLILALALMAGEPSIKILAADLTPQTLAGFDRCVKATEVRITQDEKNPSAFLYFDSLPASGRSQVQSSLRQGQVFITKLTTLDASGRAILAPGGLIHHWLGMMFIPGVTMRQVLSAVQDYNHEQDYYRPEVIRSRLIAHQRNEFRIYLRLQEKKVITVTLDTDHDVRYTELDPARWSSRSYSTRIQEVRNAGQPDEYLLPAGHDGGFLWRIDSYWRFAETEGGVDVQCESISLTRDIPTGLGWMLEPLVTSLPKETLEDTLRELRNAVLAQARK